MINTKPARIWEETLTIPTYPVPPPDPNPMFFENRVNQGASGRVYPNPFTDRVNQEEGSVANNDSRFQAGRMKRNGQFWLTWLNQTARQ